MALGATIVSGAAAVALRKVPLLATWVLTDDEVGTPIACVGFNDKSVHVYGTFNGATVTILGGNVNDAAKFGALKDFDGVALSFVAVGINSIRDNIGYMQPVVTGGTDAGITIVVLME